MLSPFWPTSGPVIQRTRPSSIRTFCPRAPWFALTARAARSEEAELAFLEDRGLVGEVGRRGLVRQEDVHATAAHGILVGERDVDGPGEVGHARLDDEARPAHGGALEGGRPAHQVQAEELEGPGAVAGVCVRAVRQPVPLRGVGRRQVAAAIDRVGLHARADLAHLRGALCRPCLEAGVLNGRDHHRHQQHDCGRDGDQLAQGRTSASSREDGTPPGGPGVHWSGGPRRSVSSSHRPGRRTARGARPYPTQRTFSAGPRSVGGKPRRRPGGRGPRAHGNPPGDPGGSRSGPIHHRCASVRSWLVHLGHIASRLGRSAGRSVFAVLTPAVGAVARPRLPLLGELTNGRVKT